MDKKKIAIACQGGGSHTAFTAGVLKSFYEHGVFKKYDVVSFSGTSGGAICAAVAWYSLLGNNDGKTMSDRLDNFWLENSTKNNLIREIQNDTLIYYMRMVERGYLWEWKLSPGSFITQLLQCTGRFFTPGFYNLETLLTDNMDFNSLKQYVKPKSPALLIGSSNVLTNDSDVFNSITDTIDPDLILASAAIPSVFEPVKIENQYYWDGLYSENPPIVSLTQKDQVGKDRIPDEIWVIQINPVYKNEPPKDRPGIEDRENEMIGNMSLLQGLDYLENMNEMLENNAFTSEYKDDQNLKKTGLYVIQMSKDLQNNLDLPSKLDRSKFFITALMRDGKSQGEEFLQNKIKFKYSGKKGPHDRPVKSKRMEKRLDTIEELEPTP